MKRTVVHTDKVPPARVPLSQAIKIGDWVFASGQLGMDPKTGRLIEGGIRAETRQVCENHSWKRLGTEASTIGTCVRREWPKTPGATGEEPVACAERVRRLRDAAAIGP